jgi:hypothetical protein
MYSLKKLAGKTIMKVEILLDRLKLTKNIREFTRNRFTPIKFIAPESIELGVKKEELDSAIRP